jgi:hypothetical protein
LIVNCFPPAVASGGTAPFGSSIIFFGGVGEIKEVPVDHGCSYEISESFGYVFDYAWNNCLHEYDTLSGLWRELKTSGTRPPPSSRFTFNKIDPHRAILFGGKQNKYKVTFSDVYIYNYDMRESRSLRLAALLMVHYRNGEVHILLPVRVSHGLRLEGSMLLAVW